MKARLFYPVVILALLVSFFPAFIPASASDGEVTFVPPTVVTEKGNPKLDPKLDRLISAQAPAEMAAHVLQAETYLPGEGVRVIVDCQQGMAEMVAQAAASFGTVEVRYGDLVQVLIPISNLTALAELPGVKFVGLPMTPVVDSYTSEGVPVINADDWQTAGMTGAGVKIGVLDAGFAGYTARQAEGELPNPLGGTWWCPTYGYGPGDEIHGTGCAEIVYDIAPDATFYLANFYTLAEMGDAVTWMIGEGVDIITCSVGWLTAGSGDGTGPVCDIVTMARNAGILWSQSAGNYAQRHWQGDFTDISPSDNWHEFSGNYWTNGIWASDDRAIGVAIRWDDPWGASSNNYDLYLLDDNGYIAARSEYTQDGTGGDDFPCEWLSHTANYTGWYHVAIRNYNASENRNIHCYSYYQDLWFQTESGSFSMPSDSPDAMSVGAVFWDTPGTLETFSSHGPTDDGRTKPDIVAPDGVSGASYGPSDDIEFLSGGTGFWGTSAAAPHAAGAAALVKQLYPSYGPDDIQAYLEGNAFEIGGDGKDNLYGSGRIDLGIPPETGGSISGYVYEENGTTPIEGGTVSAFIHGPLSTLVEPPAGETTTDAAGYYTITGLAAGNYRVIAFAGEHERNAYPFFNQFGWGDPVIVVDGQDTPNINFTLSPGGTISGTIVSQDTGLPLSGISVAAPPSDTPGFPYAIAITDENGDYVLDGLPYGDYIIAAPTPFGLGSGDDGNIVEIWEEKAVGEGSDLVTVGPGLNPPDIDFTLEQGGTISGHVQDQYGTPIVYEHLRIFNYHSLFGSWQIRGIAVTDENGDYKTTGIPAGQYAVRAIPEGYAHEWYNETFYKDNADIVEVGAPGTNTPNINFVLEPGGSISGNVYESDGTTAIQNLHVYAVDNANGKWIAGVNTDADGRYDISGLPDGSYLVKACSSCSGLGYIDEWYDDVTDQNHATSVTVTAPNETTGVDFTLEEGGSISGYVYATDGGAPIEGAQIDAVVYDTVTSHRIHLGWAHTNADGYYVLSGLPDGQYGVWVRVDGYASEWWENTYFQNEASPVTVTAPDETTDIDFSLEAGGYISGYVYESDGSTHIPDLHVQAYDEITGQWMSSTNTDSNGHYILSGLPDRSYLVRTYASWFGLNFIDEWYNDVTNQNDATPVIVTAPGETTSINFNLDEGGSISGHVYATDGGAPIEGAQVDAVVYDTVTSHRIHLGWAHTNADGYYVLSGLPDGQYGVWVRADGYASEWWEDTYFQNEASPVTVTAPDETTDIDFSLEAGGYISGYVYESDGSTHIPDLHVQTFDEITGCWMAGANSDSNGYYILSGLPAGDYLVKACASCSGLEYIDEWYDNTPDQNLATPVTVIAPDEIQDIDFTLDAGGTISGHVYELDGNTPVPGAQISLIEYDSLSGYRLHRGWAQTDENGYYISTAVPGGDYAVWVQAANHANEWYDDAPYPDSATSVTVYVSTNTPNINFELGPAGSISGYVFESDGTTPIANLHLYATDNETDAWASGTMTNTDGYYTITGLREGYYTVRACAVCTGLGYIDEWYNNTTDRASATPVYVTAPGEVMNINFSLEDAGDRNIIGTTREVNCAILPGVTVQLYNNDILQSQVMSNDNGEYRLWFDGTGTFTVVTGKPGYREEIQTIEITEQQYDYELDFTGDSGIIPNEFGGMYFSQCMNRYLYGTGDCEFSGDKFSDIMNAYLYPVGG